MAPPAKVDSRVVGAQSEHPSITDDQQPRGVRNTTVGQDPGALLRPDARAIAEHQAKQRQRRSSHQTILLSVKRVIRAISTNVIASIVTDRTEMGPQSLLSRRSNMVTETVLVRAVKSRIVAESSRIDPTKIRIHVATTPLRMSGAVMSIRVRIRVAPKMRPASSSSGCTARSDAPICWKPTGISLVT